MKNKYYLLFLLIPLAGFYLFNGKGVKQAAVMQSNAVTSQKALLALETKLNRKLEVEWNTQNQLPVFVRGKLTAAGYSASSTRAADGIKFISENKELFGLKDPGNELKLISMERDQLSMTHVKYQQMINEVEVFHGQLSVHFNSDGSIESVNGRYLPTPQMDLTPSISKSSAISIAKSGLRNYKAESEQANLMIYSKELSDYLVYGVKLPAQLTPNMIVFVNARSGEIIKVDDGIRYDGPVTGTGIGLNGQLKTINTYLSGGTYFMLNAALPMYKPPIDSFFGVIRTFDGQRDTAGNGLQKAILVSDPNNDNNFNDNQDLKAAVDAHYYTQKVYEFYKSHYNRNGIDNNGMSMINVVHYKDKLNNAFSSGNITVYGDGDGVQLSNTAEAFDVIAHEITHSVTTFTAALVYELQSGAINESMSDVFGTLVDSTDWLLGEDIYTPGIAGDAMRNMQDPHNGQAQGDINKGWQPAHMSEFVTLENKEDQDFGGVHINSGIPNKAFYNVASQIGFWKSGRIWYRALTVYLTNNSQFTDLRLACLNSAKDLYGAASQEYNTVSSAFDAVGITGSGPGPGTVDLVYDDDSPGTGVYENAANWALAVKLSSPAGADISNVKVYISGDNLGSDGHFYLIMLNESAGTGLPYQNLINPYLHTPSSAGWQSFNVTNRKAPGNFFVGVLYDGTSQPLVGADMPPGNGRSYEYDPDSKLWFKLIPPYDYTLFIRASIKTATGVTEIDTRVPERFEVMQNYPNPFNPSTSIKYSLPKAENVKITIYDMTGKQVAELVNQQQEPGTYEVTWNSRDNSGNTVASGIYLYTIEAGKNFQTNKMLLLK